MRRQPLVTGLVSAPARAEETGFILKDAVDVSALLAPPPGVHELRTVEDLNELRVIQATRTPERVAVASADVEETVFRLTIAARLTRPSERAAVSAYALDGDGRGDQGPRPDAVVRGPCRAGERRRWPRGRCGSTRRRRCGRGGRLPTGCG